MVQSEQQRLEGRWQFALDRDDVGIRQAWFARELPDQIRLPGVLQAQGYGDEISINTPWVLGLGGEWWKLQPAALRAAFSQPGRVEVPFLSQPPRHYLGAAWYQRDFEIPRDWKTRRVQLFLERPRWESTVWIDERQVGSMRSLVAPHEFELGVLEPGKHRLTIRLDNRMIVSDVAGTTRDAIDTELSTPAGRFLLVDTAGIRRPGKLGTGVERHSVMRAATAVDRCDVAVLVIDGTVGFAPTLDAAIAAASG